MTNENTVVVVEDKKEVGIPAITFTRDQIELIKKTVAKGATDDELALFMYTCKRTGLDPLAKQIFFVKRKDQAAFQTSIDGYRLVADRSGKYAGNDDPVYDDEAKPTKAMVTVYKLVNGVRCPFSATARWDQYFPGEAQGFMWKKMPHLMLGKCAEALALRKAFPAELGGVYTHEEMEQAGNVQKSEPIAEPKPKTEEGYETTTFIPTAFSDKPTSTGKAKFAVKRADDTWFSTFSTSIGAILKDAYTKKESVLVSYEQKGEYFNIKEAVFAPK